MWPLSIEFIFCQQTFLLLDIFWQFFFQNRKTNSIVPLKFYLRKLYSFLDIWAIGAKCDHFQMSTYRANKLFYYWIFFDNFFFQNQKTNSIVPLKFYLRKLYSFWDIQLLVPKNGQNLNFFCDISNFHLTLDCNNFLMSRPILTNLYLIYS